MRSFLCLILLFFFSCASAHSLIFVHLGQRVPTCIFTTMKQARYLNQNCPIYLLTDQAAYAAFEKEHACFFAAEKIDLVHPDRIPLTIEHQTFRKINPIPPSMAEGFWVYATERLFVLYDFIRETNLEEVVHLESDSMLYIDLEELLPLFKSIRLAAPFQSLYGCIPCFLFIKDLKSFALLIDHILSEMQGYRGMKPHLCLNDMQTLASFYRKFGTEGLTPLPTLMPEYRTYYPTRRRSLFPPDNSTPFSFLSAYSSLFTGYIFDAAGLGIFFNGEDPRISPRQGPGVVHSRCLFNPQVFSFFWENIQEKKIPYLSFKGKKYRIINLHFHSKAPEDYTSY